MATQKFFHGDCLQKMKDLSDGSIDLFVCDLPYGCLIGGAGKEKKKRQMVRYVDGKPTENTAVYDGGVIAGCSWDVPIDLEEFWKQVKRLARTDTTPVLMFCTTKFGFQLYNSNPKWFRYDLVWDKERGTSFLCANRMPMRSHEMVYVFAKNGAHYNRIDISGAFPAGGGGASHNSIYGDKAKRHKTPAGRRCVRSVIQLTEKTQQAPGKHPTEKPIELYKWLIQRYCPEGGTVLDPTAGSFNSCFAAQELGRHSIGIEKEEKYYKRALAKLPPEAQEEI